MSYYDRYVDRFGIQVSTGIDVRRVDPRGSWRLSTASGTIHASAVVIATGRDGTPVLPDWTGRDQFAGTLIHA